MLAHPNFERLVADHFANFGVTTAHFVDDATLQPIYAAQSPGAVNNMWTRMIQQFRGFHGHRLSGSPAGAGHDCPGPLFDWHRFARQLWDWWWFPFDIFFHPVTMDYRTWGTPRSYRGQNGSAPIIEYYFDDLDPPEPERHHDTRIVDGVHGPGSAPSTFRLEETSPVHALANGELVAARFAMPANPNLQVSMSFVLVRHEVFHQLAPAGAPAGRLDFDVRPSAVYSLYMHLGRNAQMSLEEFAPGNPDWLNRVLLRYKECELGIDFHDGLGHPGVPAANFQDRPPAPGGYRPGVLEGWRLDRIAYGAFLGQLRAGEVAQAPRGVVYSTPIQIILGDYLGDAGVIHQNGAVLTYGVRVEVFSPGWRPPGFVPVLGWGFPPIGGPYPMIPYPSEWAHQPTGAEAALLEANGVDTSLVWWWPAARNATVIDPRLQANEHLPHDGLVNHFRPLDFLAWINDVTWKHEWSKYGNAAPAPVPPRPPSRRV
jgi:hypothetical protein